MSQLKVSQVKVSEPKVLLSEASFNRTAPTECSLTTEGRPVHGGRLIAASKEYGIPLNQWLDLSTGISPDSWLVPPLPESVWRELPQQDDCLVTTAATYYGCAPEFILPTPGSQFAIEYLPKIVAGQQKVALPYWGYQEHVYHWLQAGHQPVFYHSAAQLQTLVERAEIACAVVINPNNPTAELIECEPLLVLAERLASRGGFLVVDEAFIDPQPDESLCPRFDNRALKGLVVLRSVGKFFGLAGLRLGFVVAEENLLARLNHRLSPWAVSHPARWVGQQALADVSWQVLQRQRLLMQAGEQLVTLKELFSELHWVGSALFSSGFSSYERCQQLYQQLARQGVLVRLLSPSQSAFVSEVSKDGLDFEAGVRIGLPGEAGWEMFQKIFSSRASVFASNFSGVSSDVLVNGEQIQNVGNGVE